MATLTVRNLDDLLKAKLRMVAAEHGHSMEEEVRQILQSALSDKSKEKGVGSQIHKHFAEAGGVSLQLKNRSLPRTPPDFSKTAGPHE